MASILKVDEMQGVTSAGDITITSEGGSATMQLQQGVAKAWAEYVQTGTQTIGDSFNVGSLTDNGTANTSLNFTNSMSNTDYSTSGGLHIPSWNSWIINYQGPGTGTVQQVVGTGTGPTQSDMNNMYFMLMGDLA